MWCLPTHKRPGKLKRFIDSVKGSDLDEFVLLMAWEGDPYLGEYKQIKLPASWKGLVVRQRYCGDKMNRAVELAPKDSFYGLLTDDIVLETPGMLAELRQGAEAGFLTYPNDGIWHERMATHAAVPGELVRALGFWAHPEFKHNSIDTILFIVAKELGLLKYLPECKIGVTHPIFKTAEVDETYADASEINQRAVGQYEKFLETGMAALIERVRSRLSGPGFPLPAPRCDQRGVCSVVVDGPCTSGQPHSGGSETGYRAVRGSN